jgi:hypothetical protein
MDKKANEGKGRGSRREGEKILAVLLFLGSGEFAGLL